MIATTCSITDASKSEHTKTLSKRQQRHPENGEKALVFVLVLLLYKFKNGEHIVNQTVIKFTMTLADIDFSGLYFLPFSSGGLLTPSGNKLVLSLRHSHSAQVKKCSLLILNSDIHLLNTKQSKSMSKKDNPSTPRNVQDHIIA